METQNAPLHVGETRTNSVSESAASSSNSNWKTVKSTKSTSKDQPQSGPSDTLVSDGWTVPVVSIVSVEDVQTSTCGIALVSMGVGKSLVGGGSKFRRKFLANIEP